MQAQDDSQPQNPNRVRGVLQAMRVQKKLMKRALDPENVQELRRAYKMHVKAAASIRRALKRIGASIKEDNDTSSSSEEEAN